MDNDIEAKKELLKNNIIDKNYDKNKFIEFCLSQKEGGDDFSTWTIDELKEIINQFCSIENDKCQQAKVNTSLNDFLSSISPSSSNSQIHSQMTLNNPNQNLRNSQHCLEHDLNKNQTESQDKIHKKINTEIQNMDIAPRSNDNNYGSRYEICCKKIRKNNNE